MRHISLDLIRVTEAAAISASKWIGSGNKEAADKAATDAMRDRLNRMDFAGEIVIGEGEKDNSYGLFAGEKVGERWKNLDGMHLGKDKIYNIAVDPIEGTTPTVTAGPEAIATMAVAYEGAMFTTPHFYADKLAYGPKISDKVTLRLDDPIERTVELVSIATGKKFENIVACVLNRPRHADLIARLRNMGVRIKLIQDCDVSGAVAACIRGNSVDFLIGIGGAPEAVISACAIKCLGGDFQCQITLKEDDWKRVGPVMGLEDLVKGPCVFIATGITDGSMLKGVTWDRGPVTNSVFMRSESGTIRWLTVNHGN